MDLIDFFYANLYTKDVQIEFEWDSETENLIRITAIVFKKYYITIIADSYGWRRDGFGKIGDYGITTIEGKNEVNVEWSKFFDEIERREEKIKEMYTKGDIRVTLYIKKAEAYVFDEREKIAGIIWGDFVIIVKYKRLATYLCKHNRSLIVSIVKDKIDNSGQFLIADKIIKIDTEGECADELMKAVLDEKKICGDEE